MCRTATLNFSMGFNIVSPYKDCVCAAVYVYGPYILHTDACYKGIAAVLSQGQQGQMLAVFKISKGRAILNQILTSINVKFSIFRFPILRDLNLTLLPELKGYHLFMRNLLEDIKIKYLIRMLCPMKGKRCICAYSLQINLNYNVLLKRHCMREPGSDGNLNVMFFKNFQIICLTTLLTKG